MLLSDLRSSKRGAVVINHRQVSHRLNTIYLILTEGLHPRMLPNQDGKFSRNTTLASYTHVSRRRCPEAKGRKTQIR